MRKMKLTYILFFLACTFPLNAQKEIPVNYFKPYRYQNNVVKAWLKGKDLRPDLKVFLNGTEVPVVRSDSGTFELSLPLAGETGELAFYSGKILVSKQLFTPLVSSDWGYFGKGTIDLICSSHQDIAWMNTPDTCRFERIHDIIIPALNIIDNDPDFRFEMEQTLNLMEVLNEVPSEKHRIIEACKNGRFMWGATMNQPYEGLESGEQLVRQAYLGKKWIKDNLPGMDAFTAYNIDVPGRSLQFPQILQKSGIKYLVVSRMKEGFYNWYSPDGSKILTYSPGNYGWSLLVYRYFEEDAITAMQKLSKVMSNWNEYYRSRNIPPHYSVIISTDAGGPKNYSKIIDEWNEIAAASGFDIPKVRHSTAEEFLGEIDVPGAKFDSISGDRPDLWLYIHGPAHYEAIKAKKSAAVTLPAAEIFSSISGILNGSLKDYPAVSIDSGWYKSIYPDHGWGGKNGEITDSIFRVSLEEGNETGRNILKGALENISSSIELKNQDNIVVYNDLSWIRNGIAAVDISKKKGTGWIITDAAGKTVPSQVITDGQEKAIHFAVENIPSIGYKTYHIKKGVSINVETVKLTANSIENRFYSAELGAGGIIKLFDKEAGKYILNTSKFAGGDLLSLGYKGNGAGEFVQVTATDMDDFQTLSMHEASWVVKSNGPAFTTFEATYGMKNFTVRQTITFYHQVKKIDFEYDIPDWSGEHNRQLRAAFPMNMESASITYDVPMGIVTVGRDELKMPPGGWAWGGTYRQLPQEINPRETENFISAGNDIFGVTMSSNLAVADWIDPTRESVSYPVLQGILLSSHKSCHGEGNWYHQRGSHHFRLSITSHAPGWQNGYNQGVAANHRLYTVMKEKPQKGKLPEEFSFISVSSPMVRLTTLKKYKDDNSLIMRFVNMNSNDEKIDLKLWVPAESLSRTNLIEEGESDTGLSGKEMKLDIEKCSIETFRLKFQNGAH